MKFCSLCKSLMIKRPSDDGKIIFQCPCQNTIEGTDDDTLIMEKFMRNEESLAKHEVFIDNSPFDPAANIVMKDCPKCKLNFLTISIVGESETVFYVCSCGFKSTHNEYIGRI